VRRIARAGVAIAALAGLASAVAACGDDGDEPVESGGSTTTTTADDEEAQVLEAYYAGWEAFAEASNPADPAHAALAETMTGDALETAQSSLTPMAEVGEYYEGPAREHSAKVRNLGLDQATVDDCTTSHAALHAADGTVIEEPNPSPRTVEAVMVNEDGTWKRSKLNVEEEPCEP
jgi:hypothetical protein